MGYVIVVLLTAGMALGQWLHGGLLFAALAWPLSIAVMTSALLSGAASLRRDALPTPWLGVLLLLGLTVWGIYRWGSAAFPSSGFLQVVNLSTGFLACVAVLFGVASREMRLALVLGVIGLGILQLLQMAFWRVEGTGIEMPWYAEPLRIWYQERLNPRVSGFYMNHNHLAWLLNAGCLLCISLCVWARISPYLKFLSGWLGGFFALGALLTLSRGGALALGGGLIAFLLLSLFVVARSRGRFRGAVLGLLLFLLVSLLGTCAYFITSNILVKERLEMVGEDMFRIETWKAAWRQAQLQPMEGTGPGSVADYGRIYRSTRIGSSETVYAHNDWLQLLAEGGWTGISLAVLAFGSLAWAGIIGLDERMRSRPKSGLPQSTEAAIGIGALSVLFACAVHSLFDFNMQLAANSLLAFCMVGLAAGTRVSYFSSALPRFARVTKITGACLVMGLSVGAFIFSTPYFFNHLRELQIANALGRSDARLALAWAEQEEVIQATSGSLQMVAADAWLAQITPEMPEEEVIKNREKAAEHFMRSAELLPWDRYPALRLASVCSQLGDDESAYSNNILAIQLDPQNALPYEYLGAIEESAGKFQDAWRVFRLSATIPGCTPYVSYRLTKLAQGVAKGTVPPQTIIPIAP